MFWNDINTTVGLYVQPCSLAACVYPFGLFQEPSGTALWLLEKAKWINALCFSDIS